MQARTRLPGSEARLWRGLGRFRGEVIPLETVKAVDVLLVPHSLQQNEATVWVAAFDSASSPRGLSLKLRPENITVPVPDSDWRAVSFASNVFIQTLHLEELQAGKRYELAAAQGSIARFATLPAALPLEGERPFTVLLGSCFARDQDEEGRFGRAVGLLAEDQRPDVKILCGDQVYLDLPIFEIRRPDENLLGSNFLSKYRRTWAQKGTLGEGFRTVLETGGAYFTADDHEFWNNYPNWTTLIPLTWRRDGREVWQKVALALYREFQSDAPDQAGLPRRFEVGRLAFFIADTRVFREEGNDRFTRDEDLNDLEAWIDDLKGPGVLVVGQPLLDKPAGGLSARFADRTLPNYTPQYTRLVRALERSPQSILLLTGDVHYGRVATFSFVGSRRQVTEVISSPSSLVNPLVGGSAKNAPKRFPPLSISDIPPTSVTTLYKSPVSRRRLFKITDDHFAILQFTDRAGRVRVKIRYWFPKRVTSGVLYSECVEPIDL